MLDDETVEEVDICISEAAEVKIFVYGLRLLCYLLETSFHLNFWVLDAWRKKSMSSVVPADGCGMSSVIVTALRSLVHC